MNVSRFDPARPSAARLFDVLAGGRDNFAADRELAATLKKIWPALGAQVRGNRGFLGRAVTWAADQGIRQFADLGTGLPAPPTVGDVARTAGSPARVVYVDKDRHVLLHVSALLARDGVAGLDADLARPAEVLGSAVLRGVIDLAEPVCVVLGLVLGFLPAEQAREVVAGYAARVAPGSCLAVSCLSFGDETMWKEFHDAFTIADLHSHAREDLAWFLGGLEVVSPGIVPAAGLRPGWRDAPASAPGGACVLAAIGRKR